MIGKHQIEHNGPARRGVGAARATLAAATIALMAMTASTVSAQVVYETIYITNNTHDNIQRVNLTGFADVTDLGVPAPGSFGIALDAAGGKMYWTDLSDDAVRRSNLDGTNVEELVSLSTGANPRNIVLDLDSSPNKMYWTDAG